MFPKDQLRGRHVLVKGARELLLSDVPEPARARFSARLHEAASGCVVFGGALNGDGYGVVRVAPTRIVLAHRLAYAIAYGSCPPHLVIDHTCQERRCCNVKHFRLTTPESNTPAIYGAPQSVRPRDEPRPLRAIEGGRIVTYPSVAACFAEIERRATELHGQRCAHGYFFCATCRRQATRPTARAVPNTVERRAGRGVARTGGDASRGRGDRAGGPRKEAAGPPATCLGRGNTWKVTALTRLPG